LNHDLERSLKVGSTAESASLALDETSRRGRRRFRLIVVAVTAAIAIVAANFWWRMRSLHDLPDIGDPFDVALASRPVYVPESANAYVLYSEARVLRVPLPAGASRVDFTKLSWAKAGTIERDYLDANRPALEVWREGTERPDALFHQPDSLKLDSILAIVDDLRSLAMLGFLEASRLEEKGRMGEAWSWYKAMLRSSRHVGKRGVMLERVTGAYIHRNATRRIVRWAGDPRVDAALLRRALEDTLTADALTPPLSENMKLEYLMCVRDLIELRVTVDEIPLPGGRQGLLERITSSRPLRTELQRARLHGTNDVERSRRVLNLLYANWLAQVDKPAGLRAPIAARLPFVIYAADPSAPAAARAIAPEKLIAAIRQTLFAQEYVRPNYWKSQGGAPWAGAGW
jgi:hypothetical protein